MVWHNFLIFFMTISVNVEAQIDPSSAVLLRGSGSAPDKGQLDSSRYTIRPGEPRLVEPKEPAEAPKPVNKAPPRVTPNRPASVETGVSVLEPVVVEPTTASTPVTEQVKELMLGGTPEQIDLYRDRLHPDDIRHNLIELTVAPGFSYTESSSNYWFRSFSSSAPLVMVGADLWVTPFFGVHTDFYNTMTGSIVEGVASRDRISFAQQWFDAGLRFRNFFGVTRRASFISFGLDFSEYQAKVPANATERMGTKTSGAKFLVETTLPRGVNFAWQLGVFVLPRADHKEITSAVRIRSGTSDKTTTVGLWLGAEHIYSRSSRLFWRVQHSVERTFFEGPASTTDPVSGTTLEGVSVTNGITIFTFGYRWGN